MSSKEQIDAILRVVSNRCRNLRKVIDRARALESAKAQGQVLNEEQRESVRGIVRKEALLTELQEILKKQTAIADPREPAPSKVSKRAAKAAKAKAKDKDSAKSTSERGSEEGEQAEKVPEMENLNVADNENQVGNGVGGVSTKEHEAIKLQAEQVAKERDALVKEVAELKIAHEKRLADDKIESVRKALNLFHIVDFLRQPGSREALLSYYESPEGKKTSRSLNGLHLDLLCYFNLMLTSPNGNVPHHDAVEVSTLHCLAYLRDAPDQAFEGTPYASLVEIANVIASCPILTERGDDGEEPKTQGIGDGSTDKSEVTSGKESGHIINEPITE